MTIRKATDNEAQAILNQALDVLKEATMGYVVSNHERVMQMMSPFLSNGGYYLVYFENNVVKGWIGIGSTIDYLSDEMVGIIPEIYVIPQYREQGIAEKLCTEALQELRKVGLKKVQLNVFTGNHAKQLYQKLGFQEVSTLMERNLGL